MTLFRLLLSETKNHVAQSMNVMSDDRAFYKEVGKAEMCSYLIDMLSDDTLMTKVMPNAEPLTKKRNLD